MNRLTTEARAWKLMSVALSALLFLGGCMPQILYKPSTIVSPKPVLPLRVAVQPFKDGTEAPPKRKFFLIPCIIVKTYESFNYARPLGNYPPLMPPELWSNALAAELRHSGLFADVQSGQAADTAAPDIVIEGTLQKVEFENRLIMVTILPVYMAGRQRYAFSLRALRPGDRKVLWEGKVERSIPKMAPGSGEAYAAVMQSMFLEASQNLVKGLQAASTQIDSAPAPAGVNESVEDILKRLSR